MPHAFAYPGAFPKKRREKAQVESSPGKVAPDGSSIEDPSNTENRNSQEVWNRAENEDFMPTSMLDMLRGQVADSEEWSTNLLANLERDSLARTEANFGSYGSLEFNPPASSRNTLQTVSVLSRHGSEQSRLSFQSDTSAVPQSRHSRSSSQSSTTAAARAAWRRNVEVWQEDGSGQAKKLSHNSAVFDTGCEKFNWVSRRVIDRLIADCSEAPDTVVCSFDGRTLRTSRKTRLCFKDPNSGGSYEAEFLVLESANSPFDLLLGQKWCHVHGVIGPAILGLAPLKSTPADKKAKKKRDKEYKDEKAKNECARKLVEKIEKITMTGKEMQAEEVGESSQH